MARWPAGRARASGTLTLTRPGSSPVAGLRRWREFPGIGPGCGLASVPERARRCQAGWPGRGDGQQGLGDMDSTVWRQKECQVRTWCWSRPAWPFPCWKHSSTGISSCDADQDGSETGRPSGRGSRRTPGQMGRTGCGGSAASAAARQCRPTPRRSRGGPCSRARTSGSPTPHPAPSPPPRRPSPCAGRQRDREVHRDREHVPLPGLLACLPQLRAAAVDLVGATQANGIPAPAAPVIIFAPSAGLVMNAVSSGMCAFSSRDWSAHQDFGR